MESSEVARLSALLENWSKAKSRVHFSFKNKWEGWNFDTFSSLDEVELIDGVLRLVLSGWVASFSVEQFKKVSIVNPLEVPEGVSFPSSETDNVAYVSDKVVLIHLVEKDGQGSKADSHSFLAIAKMTDSFPSV